MAISVVANPDPVWDSGTSSWTVAPPASGVGDAWYTVDDLPDPGGYPAGYYPLGAASSIDGTATIESGAQQWAPSLATPSAPNFNSAYPFKPEVRPYTHLAKDGTTVAFPKAACFLHHDVAHMWADTASLLDPPFTILMVGIVRSFPNIGYTHYLFDSGQNPTTGGQTFTADTLTAPVVLDEIDTYRTALTARISTAEAFSDPSALDKHISVPYTDDARPRMFFGVFDTTSSLFGHYSPSGLFVRSGNLPSHGAQRYLVMGRANGIVDPDQASSMIVFEVRIWGSALSLDELAEQYGQLSSTWRFGEFA